MLLDCVCVCVWASAEVRYLIKVSIHPHYWKFFCRGTEINTEAHDSFSF